MPRSKKQTENEKKRNKALNVATDFFTSYDDYGESVSFSFNGDDTKKTIPGGIVSIFVWICLLSYSVLQLKIMINKEDWALVNQVVL